MEDTSHFEVCQIETTDRLLTLENISVVFREFITVLVAMPTIIVQYLASETGAQSGLALVTQKRFMVAPWDGGLVLCLNKLNFQKLRLYQKV